MLTRAPSRHDARPRRNARAPGRAGPPRRGERRSPGSSDAGRPVRWTPHARHAHARAAGLPSAARRPGRPDAGRSSRSSTSPAPRSPATRRWPASRARAGPDVWFAAAAEAGLAAELEALAIHKALAVVPDLPADTFLTVNVSPHILGVRAGAGRAGHPARPAPRRRRADRAHPGRRPRRAAPPVRRAARRGAR